MSDSILNKVQNELNNINFDIFTKQDVLNALSKDSLSFNDLAALLSPATETLLEDIAVCAKHKQQKHFGNGVKFYTPLYLSNYCDNGCTYCGYNADNKIKRAKLTLSEIEKEFKAIAKTGLKEILLLTGESAAHTDLDYILSAVTSAKKYFTTIGLETYPMDADGYSALNKAGADFVSVYQETYDRDLYGKYHIMGPKKNYDFRFNSLLRAVNGGMRGVSFGALFGLGDFRYDAYAVALHAYFLLQSYPHTEIGFSVPRLRNFINSLDYSYNFVSEKQLFLVMCALRIFMPFTTISISSRERAEFRDNVIGICANKMSVGVKTSVGGHFGFKKGDEQFDTNDDRNIEKIHSSIVAKGLQPVYNDYINLTDLGNSG